tara:strand:+ start:530 stop:1021 length:492 start_codon:yes stop_codon:yes gene_type:complete
MAGKIKKLAEKIANPGDLVKANIYSSPIKNIGKVMQIEIAKKIAGKPKKMELGGDVPVPKRRPKKDQFRADKTESLDKEFSKKVAKQNEKNMKNVKKMEDGGLIGGQKKLDKNKDGKISGDDFAMMEYGGKVEEYGGGGKVKGGKMSCRGMGAALRGGGYTIS